MPPAIDPALSARLDATLAALSDAARHVAHASALLWSFRPRSHLLQALDAMGARKANDKKHDRQSLDAALLELERTRLLTHSERHNGYMRLSTPARALVHRRLLRAVPAAELAAARDAADPPWWLSPHSRLHIDGVQIVAGRLRFDVLAGATLQEVAKTQSQVTMYLSWPTVVQAAFEEDLDADLLDMMQLPVASWLCESQLMHALHVLEPAESGLVRWATDAVRARPNAVPVRLRATTAQYLLQCGDADSAARLLEGADADATDAVRACLHLYRGEYDAALPGFVAAFERAYRRGHAATSAANSKGASKPVPRKQLGRDDLPTPIAWPYLLALLADGTATALEHAQAFALARSGKRRLEPEEPWGLWAHAAQVRLGATPLQPDALLLGAWHRDPLRMESLWRLLIIAWLGHTARQAFGDAPKFDKLARALAQDLATKLRKSGFEWFADLADAALAVLEGNEPRIPFFVRGGERWRDVLKALQALDEAPAPTSAASPTRRYVWRVGLAADGAVLDVRPCEQKFGARGWGKPAVISPARIAKDTALEPHDLAVVRTLREDRFNPRSWLIDRAQAMIALIGHPHVVFEDAPHLFVELVEDTPELEVLEEAGQLRLQLSPEPHALDAFSTRMVRFESTPWLPNDEDGLRLLTVLRDSPQRARLVRYTPTQLRAHALLSEQSHIPEAGREALQQTLRALAKHFRVHGDAGTAVRSVEAQSTLRAELAPVGQGLRVRLVVAPFGPDGPRLVPGAGRARVITHLDGEALTTERALTRERALLEQVLDALPVLEFDARTLGPAEWELEDPDAALEVVERLPLLKESVAIDWPKGQSVRVRTVDVAQLSVNLRTDRDWLRLDATLQVEEAQVLTFEALLDAARRHSRYVPMGDGLYAALSQELKQRLEDLATVAEPAKGGALVAPAAAPWLRDALDQVAFEGDAGVTEAFGRLDHAREFTPPPPPGLQTTLRPYQQDGYEWAMRLAAAGLGGCLADDMGLGKTIQAIAVLCARAAQGAALVVAPTSVCGNWIAEIERFAPALQAIDFASTDRDEALRAPAPMQVIVVSYTLLLQERARFTTPRWHTLIVDEAQTIKNPGAKRTAAVCDLDAGFRLALSGTPVENRLLELWSILRFSTPGLLGTSARFTERFVRPIERDRDRAHLAQLRRLIAPFVLRRTKAQVLRELPERTELVLTIVPDASEAAHYEALRRQAVAAVDQSLLEGATSAQARFNILAQLTRMRRAACDPRLITPEFGGAGEKVQAFVRLAEDLVANGHKALVFSQFVDFLDILRAALDAAGLRYQTLDGSTPAPERTRRVHAFQGGDGDLFLISLKAGGTGLNLTAADYVVITDPWWNPAVEDQATGRAHRIGQQRPVTVYRLVNAGTIEERIVELHREKRDMAESILETGDAAALPSTAELLELIRGE